MLVNLHHVGVPDGVEPVPVLDREREVRLDLDAVVDRERLDLGTGVLTLGDLDRLLVEDDRHLLGFLLFRVLLAAATSNPPTSNT